LALPAASFSVPTAPSGLRLAWARLRALDFGVAAEERDEPRCERAVPPLERDPLALGLDLAADPLGEPLLRCPLRDVDLVVATSQFLFP
jgi:hypothetical protein